MPAGFFPDMSSRWSLMVVLACACAHEVAQGSTTVCTAPADQSELSATFVGQGTATLEPPPGTTREQHRDFDLLVKPDAGRFSFGLGHRYAILNFDDVEPQTNGHLHTTYFPVHWIRKRDRGSFRLSAAPALSASSNIIGHPQEYRGDTLQFLFALSWRREASGLTFRYGICGDHRFGEYAVYPTVAVEWEPHPDWTLDIGFPDTRVTYRVTDRLSSGIGLAPEGNEWHVANRSMTEESRFVYEGYAIDWELRWEALPGVSVSAAVGAPFESRYEFVLSSGERTGVRADPVIRFTAGVRWRF